MKNNLTDLLEFYQINDLLTEAYHIYQPSKFSLYRKNNQVNKQIVNVIKLFPKYLKDNNL